MVECEKLHKLKATTVNLKQWFCFCDSAWFLIWAWRGWVHFATSKIYKMTIYTPSLLSISHCARRILFAKVIFGLCIIICPQSVFWGAGRKTKNYNTFGTHSKTVRCIVPCTLYLWPCDCWLLLLFGVNLSIAFIRVLSRWAPSICCVYSHWLFGIRSVPHPVVKIGMPKSARCFAE